MATKPPVIKFEKEKLLGYLPLASQIALILFFLFFIFFPQIGKIGKVSKEIKEKSSSLTLLERGSQDMSKLKKDLSTLESKAEELDQRLPLLVETNILIDSLKAITQESRIKFTSIEPMAANKFDLPDSLDTYYELPIRIKLICGFFETIDFMKKIERSKRLMKISSLSIKGNPGDVWNHSVELVISTFAKENKKGTDK